MKKVIFETEGMHCRSCEVLIEDAILDMEGIEKISVSHKNNFVKVEFDETKTNTKQIKQIIINEGYEIKTEV